ncbi:MAG: hypothetical protein KIG55_02470 [Myroides sp.]|jgi:hypothetical protein|nr:hypothetical protein [uncultured Flavobacterium sp.]MBS7320443.1 hypothetical protein [Myroides sp.]
MRKLFIIIINKDTTNSSQCSTIKENLDFIKILFGLLNFRFIFVNVYTKNSGIMFEFQQFIAFLIGLTVLIMGFWLMFFLISFVIYWAFGGAIDLIKENKAKKEQEQA